MKTLALWLAVLLMSVGSLFAQVTVEVTTKQDGFLPSESLPVAVRIINRSGQTLHLGADEDWLTFTVEARDGYVVQKYGDVPVVGARDLESSKVATKRVDLAPYFSFSKPGRYTIIATVKIKEWGATIVSEPKPIDIIQGLTVWEQDFGVPTTNHEQPEVRKYALQKAVFLENMQLYLRLTDGAESQIYKVLPLGIMTSFSKPDTKLDRKSNLHLIFQTGMRSFIYTAITPQGDVAIRQRYDYSGTRPQLKIDDDGRIMVSGGVRHIMEDDIPAKSEQAASADVPPVKN